MLWEVLNSLGLPNKLLSYKVSALRVNKTVQYDTNLVLAECEYYCSNATANILKKLLKPPNKCALKFVLQQYKDIIQNNSFNIATHSKEPILTILKNTKISETADLDNLCGSILQDGLKVLTKLITYFCNLSITSGSFLCRRLFLLPLILKVIQKVNPEQTSVFLNSRNLLYNYHSKFCKNHSPHFCLSIYTKYEILNGFDKSLINGKVVIDPEKLSRQ